MRRPTNQAPSSPRNSSCTVTVHTTCVSLRLAGGTPAAALTVPRSLPLGTRYWSLWFCCLCSTSSGADPGGPIRLDWIVVDSFATSEMARFYSLVGPVTACLPALLCWLATEMMGENTAWIAVPTGGSSVRLL